MADKPYSMLSAGGRARRWYPHQALENVTGALENAAGTLSAPPTGDAFSWHLLRAEDAAAQLPHLKAALTELHRFASMIERIADGQRPSTCTVCSSHFYPSRVDAKYCSGRCRTRAHRGQDGSGIEPNRRSPFELGEVALTVQVVETPCGEQHLVPELVPADTSP